MVSTLEKNTSQTNKFLLVYFLYCFKIRYKGAFLLELSQLALEGKPILGECFSSVAFNLLYSLP